MMMVVGRVYAGDGKYDEPVSIGVCKGNAGTRVVSRQHGRWQGRGREGGQLDRPFGGRGEDEDEEEEGSL